MNNCLRYSLVSAFFIFGMGIDCRLKAKERQLDYTQLCSEKETQEVTLGLCHGKRQGTSLLWWYPVASCRLDPFMLERSRAQVVASLSYCTFYNSTHGKCRIRIKSLGKDGIRKEDFEQNVETPMGEVGLNMKFQDICEVLLDCSGPLDRMGEYHVMCSSGFFNRDNADGEGTLMYSLSVSNMGLVTFAFSFDRCKNVEFYRFICCKGKLKDTLGEELSDDGEFRHYSRHPVFMRRAGSGLLCLRIAVGGTYQEIFISETNLFSFYECLYSQALGVRREWSVQRERFPAQRIIF